MTGSEWIVHPNRSELGPRQTGMQRPLPIGQPPARPGLGVNMLGESETPAKAVPSCRSRRLGHIWGLDWWFVVGAARIFARRHIGGDVPPPFGFKDCGKWWWNNTTSEESILDRPEAIDYVREYLDRLFRAYR
jgi:hypothetical protein